MFLAPQGVWEFDCEGETRLRPDGVVRLELRNFVFALWVMAIRLRRFDADAEARIGVDQLGAARTSG